MKSLFKVAEVAEATGCSKRTVCRWIADGSLRAVKLGGSTRVIAEDLAAFIAAAPARTPATQGGQHP